ncbi:MAG: ATP-binding cassette domain-containing protein [Phycisphaerae bacterium]|nr:ATP-binding cassette domain-containing protein [Phycisphaerae bacterium]
MISVVGPNGGGKTTLLKLILGLLHPDRGQVRVLGALPEQARRRVGYTPQHTAVDAQFPASVTDVVLMGRLGHTRRIGPFTRMDRTAALEALEEVDLADLRRRPFAALSGGQQQRAIIARALVGSPELLLLDEPTAGLDVAAEQRLYDLLRRLNERMTIVMTSHDIGIVSQLVGRVICVKGTTEIHPTEELTGEMLRDLYATDVRMVRHDRDGRDA